MDAPRADDTPLYDQLNPRPPRSRRRPRRRMRTADRVLAGMSAAAIAGVTMIYGIVAYGWGAGPEPEVAPQHRTIQISTPTETPTIEPTSRHVLPHKTRMPVVVVVAPTRYSPRPTHSAIVTPTPTRTSESPSAPQTSSSAPEPTQTTQSPSGTPSETPTASQSTTPASPSISLEP